MRNKSYAINPITLKSNCEADGERGTEGGMGFIHTGKGPDFAM